MTFSRNLKMNLKIKKNKMDNDLISRQMAIDAADDMVEPQESEDKE